MNLCTNILIADNLCFLENVFFRLCNCGFVNCEEWLIELVCVSNINI